MMPLHAYMQARRDARHHVLVELIDLHDHGCVRACVKRVYRSDGKLVVGDEIQFKVPVELPGIPIPRGAGSWTSLEDWMGTRYMEAYLNGEPPECNIAANSEYVRLPRFVFWLGHQIGFQVLREPSSKAIAAAWKKFKRRSAV